ncbi:MAG: hypothetical protein KF900_12455 [Bacteroidetes bacterium]|nr:hypothetical protein [Bacteroidota bacterium]
MQSQPSPFPFYNSLAFHCGGPDVDITWEFYDSSGSNPPCCSGSANVLNGAVENIIWATGYDEITITLTAIGGCAINPISVSVSFASAPPTKTGSPNYIPCGQACFPSPPPPGSTCCDNGSALAITATGNAAYVQ